MLNKPGDFLKILFEKYENPFDMQPIEINVFYDIQSMAFVTNGYETSCLIVPNKGFPFLIKDNGRIIDLKRRIST